MTFWEVGTITQRIGELAYIVQGPKNTYKRHVNQLRKCRLNESKESPQNTCEEPINAIFDHFDLDTPQVSPEIFFSSRASYREEKKIYATTRRKSQEKEILIVLIFSKKIKENSWKGVLWDRNLPASWTLPALYH